MKVLHIFPAQSVFPEWLLLGYHGWDSLHQEDLVLRVQTSSSDSTGELEHIHMAPLGDLQSSIVFHPSCSCKKLSWWGIHEWGKEPDRCSAAFGGLRYPWFIVS